MSQAWKDWKYHRVKCKHFANPLTNQLFQALDDDDIEKIRLFLTLIGDGDLIKEMNEVLKSEHPISKEAAVYYF